MNAFENRIAKLLDIAENIQKAQKRNRTYAELRIPSLMKDSVSLIFHYKNGPIERHDSIDLNSALNMAGSMPTYCNLLHCIEWAHSFYQHSDLYDENQKISFKMEDMERYEEIRELYEMECAMEAVDLLAHIPQIIYRNWE